MSKEQACTRDSNPEQVGSSLKTYMSQVPCGAWKAIQDGW
jgi:hypothetical protein